MMGPHSSDDDSDDDPAAYFVSVPLAAADDADAPAAAERAPKPRAAPRSRKLPVRELDGAARRRTLTHALHVDARACPRLPQSSGSRCQATTTGTATALTTQPLRHAMRPWTRWMRTRG
jgi:hypothetical protein